MAIISITNRCYAQAPVISSFSPERGPIGTTVTISGSNFNTTASNNIVYFGAEKANVISSTASLLMVNVPLGTNYQPLSVTTNGLTGYSQSPFNATFNGPQFTANSFNNTLQVQSGATEGIAIKDMDGDGKPDLVIVNEESSSVSFFLNQGQPGAPKFALPLQKGLNGYSIGVAIGDLDGDGKPDVVVANFNANTISIFKNTSTIGQLSFNNAITLPTLVGAYDVAIADFNGDGKPDIAVTNDYSVPSKISVFTNATAPNGQISFSPRNDIPVQSGARGITAADIDMDGKYDIVVTSQSGFVSILRNTSTSGNTSFAPETDYRMPTNAASESAVVIDLDGDLKPDIAVANNNTPGSISVLKNNSSPGTISFLQRQDFVAGTNPYSICAGDIDGDGRPDIAVTEQIGNMVSVLINTSTPGNIKLAAKIDFKTGIQPRSTLINDLDGNGRPDLIVGNAGSISTDIFFTSFVKQTSIITFPPPATIAIDGNTIIDPGATSTNKETPITYTSSNPSVAYIAPDGSLNIIAPGSTVITASQAGNADYTDAIPVQQTFIIKEDQHILFPALPVETTCSADFNITATSNNTTLPVTYTSSNTAVATINSDGSIHITGAGSTIITASQSGNNLYNEATQAQQTLVVNLPVSPTVSIVADPTTACQGTPIIITATVNNANGADFNYQWQINGINTGTNDPSLTITAAAKTDIFQCTVSDKNPCLPPATSNTITDIDMPPYQTPSVIINSSVDAPVCPGTPISFMAIATNGGANPTYQWRINDVNTDGSGAVFKSSTLNNGDVVTCELINNGGECLTAISAVSNPISIQIIPPIIPAPLVIITTSANNTYEGTAISFTATVSDAAATVDYQWQVNGTNAGNNNSVFTSSKLKNNDEITCIATTNIPCSAPLISNQIKMTLLPLTVNIPNTFTPNGDDINDFWDIPGLINYPDCRVNVYNRWGGLVYHSIGYNKAWDGTFNGKQLQAATYYYTISIDNKKRPLSGYVTIIR